MNDSIRCLEMDINHLKNEIDLKRLRPQGIQNRKDRIKEIQENINLIKHIDSIQRTTKLINNEE